MATHDDSLSISNPETKTAEISLLLEKSIGKNDLKKKVTQLGNTRQTPFHGDEVEVLYSGYVKDGSPLGSSRDNGAPLKFKLGQGEVIPGLDEGIATMKKGERAVFTVPPHLAYGEVGFPSLVPPNSTLIFLVEMISWTTIRDVTGDGGVLKKIISEGEGWATPKDGDEVSVKYEARLENGTVVSKAEEGMEFHVGDEQLCPAIHKAVKTMRKNEKAELSVKFFYGFGLHDGSSNITILLELISWRSVVDILGDKKILKKITSAGEGFDHPSDGSMVKVIYVGKTQDGTLIDQKGSHEEPFEYMCLDDQVNESLDRAIMTMKKGERAQVLILPNHAQGDELSEPIYAHSKLVYEVEMIDFTKVKSVWEMDGQEKIKACENMKQDGNTLFKQGKSLLASRKYEKAVKFIEFNHNFSEEEKSKATALMLSCDLNNAACKLKLCDYIGAARLCTKVLEVDPSNIKALFRRSQAYSNTSDLDKAEADLRKAQTIDPKDRNIKLELQVIRAKQKEYEVYQAEMFGSMISKLA